MVVLTWNRPASLLNNSLWTLSHQTVLPDEIIVVDASPNEHHHIETRRLCSTYPITKVVDAYWTRFNVSRGMNVGIKATNPESKYVAATCMEIFFGENMVEVLLSKAGHGRINFMVCGSLPEGVTDTPENVRSNWSWYCNQINPNPPKFSLGAVLCAERQWWFDVHGYDEARRPFSYPDVDINDRALRYGLENSSIGWEEAQILHPYHPLSRMFYTISGFPVDLNNPIDRNVVRNFDGWGIPQGDEPKRIPWSIG